VSDDKEVVGRSNEEVRRIAERTKAEYGVQRRHPVNIICCLESGTVPTIYGRRKLNFVTVEDNELENADGKTEFSQGEITIKVRRSVYRDAALGVGRARMTLAHELAHAVMHHGQPLFRLVGAAGSTKLAKEKAYSSAEHQAKIFAAAFLIHDREATKMQSAEEISVQFLVSLTAATYCFNRLQETREKQRSADRVRRMAEEVRTALLGNAAPKRKSFLETPCIACGATTLIPIGSKVLCDTCNFVGDQFQDGDQQ